MGAAGTPTFSGRGGGGGPGSPGPPGPQGPPGFLNELDPPEEPLAVPGPPGAQGNPGSAGATGAAGPPGMDGADGEEGPMGPPGQAGATGSPGATGAQGIQGAPGVDGDPGEDSFIPGPSGAQGATGAAGSPGAQGPQGPPGFLYDLDPPDEPLIIPGAVGAVGATGGTGATGPQGPAGLGIDGEISGDEFYYQMPTFPQGIVDFLTSATSASTVSGTATETAFSTGNFTIPAGFLRVGRTIRVMAGGIYSTAATPGSMTVRLHYGSVNTDPVLVSNFATTLPASQTNALWAIVYWFTVRTTGASGTVWGSGQTMFGTTGLTGSLVFPGGLTAVVTIDTTVQKQLTLFSQSSVTTASVTLETFVMEVLS